MEGLKKALSFSRFRIGARCDRAAIDRTGLRVVSGGGGKAFRVMPESVTIVWVQEETDRTRDYVHPLASELYMVFLTFVHGGETYAMHLAGEIETTMCRDEHLGFEVWHSYKKYRV